MIPVTLWRYISREIFRLFVLSLLCFVLILQLVDLFSNINNYLAYDISILSILRLSLLYVPKAVTYAISPALLFSTTYFLASMYGGNELISVLNSGISFFRLIIPVIVMGVVICIFSLFFTEFLVVDTFNEKQSYSAELLGFSNRANNNQIVIPTVISSEELDDDYTLIYYAKYYNDETARISSPVLFLLNSANELYRRIEAQTAKYSEELGRWEFFTVTVHDFSTGESMVSSLESYSQPYINLRPEYFRNTDDEIANLRYREARLLLSRIRDMNYTQYRYLYTDLLERISFSFTPLVVIMISSAFAWRFKKNILLFSILISLGITVLYYVVSMVSILIAKQGFVSPLAGVLLPFVIFTGMGLLLLRNVRT